MKILFRNSIICALALIFLPKISAVDSQKNYGQKGMFELSTGLAVAYSAHYSNTGQYSVGLLPFANHFLWDKIFLRYEVLLGVDYYSSSYDSFTMRLGGGLGLGYSFQFSEKWHLNVSLGYAAAYGYQKNSYSSATSGGYQTINGHPELKYRITENWTVGLLMRVVTTLPDKIAGESTPITVTTNTYIVVSYIF
jgi:hypothetical protein